MIKLILIIAHVSSITFFSHNRCSVSIHIKTLSPPCFCILHIQTNCLAFTHVGSSIYQHPPHLVPQEANKVIPLKNVMSHIYLYSCKIDCNFFLDACLCCSTNNSICYINHPTKCHTICQFFHILIFSKLIFSFQH